MRIIFLSFFLLSCLNNQPYDSTTLHFCRNSDELFRISPWVYFGNEREVHYRHDYDHMNKDLSSAEDLLRTYMSVTDIVKFQSLYNPDCANIPKPRYFVLGARSSVEECRMKCKISMTSTKTGKEINILVVDRTDFNGNKLVNEIFIIEKTGRRFQINTCDYEKLETICKTIKDWSNEKEIADIFDKEINYTYLLNGKLYDIKSISLKGDEFETKSPHIKSILTPINQSLHVKSYDDPLYDSLFFNMNGIDYGTTDIVNGRPVIFTQEAKTSLEIKPVKIFTYYDSNLKRNFAYVVYALWSDNKFQTYKCYFLEEQSSIWKFSSEKYDRSLALIIMMLKYDFYKDLTPKKKEKLFGRYIIRDKFIKLNQLGYLFSKKVDKKYRYDYTRDLTWYSTSYIRKDKKE